jgi:hypothetical protein
MSSMKLNLSATLNDFVLLDFTYQLKDRFILNLKQTEKTSRLL